MHTTQTDNNTYCTWTLQLISLLISTNDKIPELYLELFPDLTQEELRCNGYCYSCIDRFLWAALRLQIPKQTERQELIYCNFLRSIINIHLDFGFCPPNESK